MEIDAKKLYEALQDLGVKHLHHANSVQTSCLFLQHGKLMSRGVVDELGLPQTEQRSDAKDKEFGVYFDLFLDAVDIHAKLNRRNYYGPILFVIRMEILIQEWVKHVWLLKSNPEKWTATTPHEEKWYTNIEEFVDAFNYGRTWTSIVFRNIGGIVRLKENLVQIFVDDPGWTGSLYNESIFAQTLGALQASVLQGDRWTPNIQKRVCLHGCECEEDYRNMALKFGNSVIKFFLLSNR